MTTTTEQTQLNSSIGGIKNVVLLPAFSTVSSRTEMKGIANLLARQYQVTVLDWLGFGESQCPPVDYNSALFQQLLEDFVKSIVNSPIILMAASHASGYALKFAQNNPDLISQLICGGDNRAER